MAATTPDAEERVTSFVNEVWNSRNYKKIPEFVSESFEMHDPAAPDGVVHGPDGLEEFIRTVVAGFPDFQVSISDMISDGDLVMYEGMITMTHEGEFDGLPPTGRRVEVKEMSTYHLRDDMIQEHRVYFDQQAVTEQLGLTFPAVISQLPKLAWRKIS